MAQNKQNSRSGFVASYDIVIKLWMDEENDVIIKRGLMFVCTWWKFIVNHEFIVCQFSEWGLNIGMKSSIAQDQLKWNSMGSSNP